MKKIVVYVLWTVLMIITACSPRARYERMVENELESDERYDSLFLGIHLGMTDEDFYQHCWQLNKQQLVYQGSGNLSVEYRMDQLDYPARMNFYPSFYEGKIYNMPVTFKYDGWSPWNKHYHSDKLLRDVLELFKEWYGDGFMEVEHPERGSAYVKVDGNRQIALFITDEMRVSALFKDLLIEKSLDPDNSGSKDDK